MRFMLLLLLVPLAPAHQPAELESDFDVPNPYISYAVNGRFSTGDEVFTLHLELDRGFALPFELLVEKRSSNEAHRPMYAVVGPGLPPPSDELRALLPRELPEGVGVFIDKNDDAERLVIFESVMRRYYWSSDTTALALDPGAHEVWVWSPEGTTGDFVIGLGVEEDFSEGTGGLFASWRTYAY
jgi:hypothetical protein